MADTLPITREKEVMEFLLVGTRVVANADKTGRKTVNEKIKRNFDKVVVR